MRENHSNLNSELHLWQEKLFSRSIRRKRKVARIRELVGTTLNLQCLEISAGDAIISTKLRELGGSWKSICIDETARNSIGCFLNETITVMNEGQLPYEDNTFDRLVVVDALKYIANDYEFLHECHRVLKNDGWVIISESRRAPASIKAFLQRILNITPIAMGACRNGYKGHELFDKLKDGFDVPEMNTYSNSLLEIATTLGQAVHKSMLGGPYWKVKSDTKMHELQHYRRLYNLSTLALPLYWFLSLLEFLPGHQMLVKSRRRHWRPRLSPKLVDGRSIAEAAINTKIGTAAPF